MHYAQYCKNLLSSKILVVFSKYILIIKYLILEKVMESDIWMSLHTARIANAAFFLSIMVSIWIAARFSSVAAEKGVNMVGKIICSLFALGVFMGNWVVGSTVMNTYSGFAKAFEMLGETGAELSPMATGYIAYFGTEATGMPNPVMMLVGVTGLLIALSPLWFNTSD